MSFRGKILVIRGGAIGDFILTLPAIAALRRQFPESRLEVLGYPHIVQLAVAGGLVDDVRSIDARPLAGFFARNGVLAEDLRDYFSEFDLIVSYLYDPDQIFRTNVGRCSPAQFIVGPHRPDETGCVPAARVYLQPLERLAIFEADPVPQLVPKGLDSSSSTLEQLVLHPGSGSEHKNWPELRWADLLRHLLDSTGFTLLLVGGEAEGERLQRLARPLPPARTRLAQNLPLAELAAVLARSRCFIGHDSGISHLAAAVGLPGVVLWGDTSEAVWRPPSEKVIVLKHPAALARLPVGDVLAHLQAICAPA
ncbi:MAG TPA: glycosyltransferase family 9 protein [Candidatus Acidoferrum sp.]|jgi:heptosyltransferase-3|nr:glycosyltransferase family 9 protein [Candidatus Acidoferrum sp.]